MAKVITFGEIMLEYPMIAGVYLNRYRKAMK